MKKGKAEKAEKVEKKMGKERARDALSLPLLEQRWNGEEESKECFHKDAQRVLRAVAEAAGLETKDYQVSSNKFGPSLAGGVTLFTDRFHLWIYGGSRCDWGQGEDQRLGNVTARKVAHRKDYTGTGRNVAVEWELLWDPPSLVSVLKLEGVIDDV